MEADNLFSVRNLLYAGEFESCIEEAAALKAPTVRESIDRDVLQFRAMILQGRADKVAGAIVDADASTDLRAVKLLALFTAQPAARAKVLEMLAQWLSDETGRDNATLQLMAGLIYYQSGDVKEALKALRSPRNLEQGALRVQILLGLGRLDLASAELRAMQSVDDDSILTQLAHAWCNCYGAGPKQQEAGYIFQEQASKTVSTPLLLNAMAASHMQLGRFDEADKYLVDALAKTPNDPDVLVNAISCLANLPGKGAKRDELLATLRKVAPAHPIVKQVNACEATFDQIAQQAVKAYGGQVPA